MKTRISSRITRTGDITYFVEIKTGLIVWSKITGSESLVIENCIRVEDNLKERLQELKLNRKKGLCR